MRGLGEGKVGPSWNFPRTLWTPLAEEPVGRPRSCSQRVAVWLDVSKNRGICGTESYALGMEI